MYAPKILTKAGVTKENIFTAGERVLHIGSGSSKLPGSETVDVLNLPGVDKVHDLDKMPWPYEDDSFDVLYAHSVFEHLEDVVGVMEEMHRILKTGGRIVMVVPYFRHPDAFSDPTHEHFFTSRSMDYFIDEKNTLSNYSYTKKKFKKIGFWYGWPHSSKNPLKNIFKHYAQTKPSLYDSKLWFLYTVQILVWELEVIK